MSEISSIQQAHNQGILSFASLLVWGFQFVSILLRLMNLDRAGSGRFKAALTEANALVLKGLALIRACR
jgi:hypothetical protein